MSGESLRRALARRPRLLVAVARRGAGLDRIDQSPRGVRHLVDGAVEGGLVRPRGPSDAAQLSHELERGGAYLVLGGEPNLVVTAP